MARYGRKLWGMPEKPSMISMGLFSVFGAASDCSLYTMLLLPGAPFTPYSPYFVDCLGVMGSEFGGVSFFTRSATRFEDLIPSLARSAPRV